MCTWVFYSLGQRQIETSGDVIDVDAKFLFPFFPFLRPSTLHSYLYPKPPSSDVHHIFAGGFLIISLYSYIPRHYWLLLLNSPARCSSDPCKHQRNQVAQQDKNLQSFHCFSFSFFSNQRMTTILLQRPSFSHVFAALWRSIMPLQIADGYMRVSRRTWRYVLFFPFLNVHNVIII